MSSRWKSEQGLLQPESFREILIVHWSSLPQVYLICFWVVYRSKACSLVCLQCSAIAWYHFAMSCTSRIANTSRSSRHHRDSSCHFIPRTESQSQVKASSTGSLHPESLLVYLNTLPSAHSYSLPLTSIGLSHDHMSSTNSLSAVLCGSNLVNSYDSQSGATSKAGRASLPRTVKAPRMTLSLAWP
jgi:hypothetical protein